jgi:hypothetical protein
MPSIPFQYRLIKAVMSGEKPFTVRQINTKRPVKKGDTLYIYTGMRTKQCRKHGEHVCVGVLPIEIDYKKKIVTIDGVQLIPILRHWFTTTDIQGSEQDFFDFFQKMKYKKPLVLIVYNQSTYDMLTEWLRDQRTYKQIEGAVLSNFLPEGINA